MSRKVIIATILDNINTGTFLQALALAKRVGMLGYEPCIMDYCRPHMRWWNRVCENFGTRGKSPLRKILSFATISLHTLIRNRLKRLLGREVALCTPVGFARISQREKAEYLYLTGSDQVWNNVYNRGIDPVFYLQFAPEGSLKGAYAASIGQNQLDDADKENMRRALAGYRKITVREDSAKRQIEEIGYAATQVLDPTLLLSRCEWLDTLSRSRFVKREPYVLVYSVEWDQSQRLTEIAKKLSRMYGWKIYVYSTDRNDHRIECDRFFSFGTPDVFIDLLEHADFVLVSSFHGTAFSINFNKQFFSVLPNLYSSRSLSLLNQFDLKQRIYQDGMDLSSVCDIDYGVVNEKLEACRRQSLGHLRDLLE